MTAVPGKYWTSSRVGEHDCLYCICSVIAKYSQLPFPGHVPWSSLRMSTGNSVASLCITKMYVEGGDEIRWSAVISDNDTSSSLWTGECCLDCCNMLQASVYDTCPASIAAVQQHIFREVLRFDKFVGWSFYMCLSSRCQCYHS